MATSNPGGLVDPKFQGALGSSEIKANLQNEIDRKAKELGSYQYRLGRGAAYLGPYGSIGQNVAMMEEARDKDYADLFNMRQQLAQANLMDQRRGAVSTLFQGFDPDTSASLSALYQQNPEEALKKAAELRVDVSKENQKLTTAQKENLAAGLTEEDIYRKTLGHEFDLGLYGKKKAIDLTGQAGLEELKSGLDLQKDLQVKTLEAALRKEGAGSEISKSLALDAAKNVSKEAEAADKALPAIKQNIDILKNNPNFEGGLGIDTLSSLATLPLGSSILKNLAPDQFKAVENFRQYKSNIESQIIPIAKTLGANPSNQDATRLEQSIGGLSSPRKVMISNTAKLAALAEMKQQQREDILNAEGNPKAIAEITKKYSGDTLFNSYYEKYLNEMVSEVGGSIKSSSTPASPSTTPATQGQWKIIS